MYNMNNYCYGGLTFKQQFLKGKHIVTAMQTYLVITIDEGTKKTNFVQKLYQS